MGILGSQSEIFELEKWTNCLNSQLQLQKKIGSGIMISRNYSIWEEWKIDEQRLNYLWDEYQWLTMYIIEPLEEEEGKVVDCLLRLTIIIMH